MIDLRQLEQFLMIAQKRSITAAATELGVAQPTLTKSLRLLEQSLKVRLFTRHPRGVEPTEFGLTLARHAAAIKVRLNDALREIQGMRGEASAPISIGVGPSWLQRHCPRALAQTKLRHPDAKFEVRSGVDDALIDALLRDELDLAITELPPYDLDPNLQVVALTEDTHRVCCRCGHPLTRRKKLRPGDLVPYTWIGPPATTRSRRRLHALFESLNLPPPRFDVVTESALFMLETVRLSDALAFVVSTTLQTMESGVVMLDIPALAISRRAGIIIRASTWVSPALASLIEELQTVSKAQPRN
jgi:DNA-binding transcriptional LysR family regulator